MLPEGITLPDHSRVTGLPDIIQKYLSSLFLPLSSAFISVWMHVSKILSRHTNTVSEGYCRSSKCSVTQSMVFLWCSITLKCVADTGCQQWFWMLLNHRHQHMFQTMAGYILIQTTPHDMWYMTMTYWIPKWAVKCAVLGKLVKLESGKVLNFLTLCWVDVGNLCF